MRGEKKKAGFVLQIFCHNVRKAYDLLPKKEKRGAAAREVHLGIESVGFVGFCRLFCQVMFGEKRKKKKKKGTDQGGRRSCRVQGLIGQLAHLLLV